MPKMLMPSRTRGVRKCDRCGKDIRRYHVAVKTCSRIYHFDCFKKLEY